MADVELVNVFNTLYISSFRVIRQCDRYKVIFKDTFTIFLIPIILSLINVFCGTISFNDRRGMFMSNVAQLSIVIRYFAVFFIAPVLGVLFLLERHKIFNLLQQIILFDKLFWKATNKRPSKIKLRLVRAQIIFVCLMYSLMITVRLLICIILYDQYGLNTTVLFVSSLILELYFCLQQIYVQLFAGKLTLRYQLLRKALQLNNFNRLRLLSALKLYDRLISIQQLLTDTFGITFILFTLFTFGSGAVITYGFLNFLTVNIPVIFVILAPIYLIPSVVSFFGFSYQFDSLARAVSRC